MANKNKIFFSLIVIGMIFFSATFASAEFIYKSEGKRDPFVPLLGSSATGKVSGLRGVMEKEDLTLQGVLVGVNGARQAIINGEIIAEGDTVGTISVISISDNSVRIKFKEKEFDLVLYE